MAARRTRAAGTEVTAGRVNGNRPAPTRQVPERKLVLEQKQARERLLTVDWSRMSDRELLAVAVAGIGAPGAEGRAMVLADRLLERFGSVRAVVRAHAGELMVVEGVGPSVAAPLVASFEMARRAALAEPPAKLSYAADVAAVVAPLLHGRTRERVVVVACDVRRRVLGCDVICEGSAGRSLMPARETVVAVLRRDGAGFAVAHNHPSGDPRPSADDLFATSRMQQAATATGLRFLGHVVVTDTSWRPVVTYGPDFLPERESNQEGDGDDDR